MAKVKTYPDTKVYRCPKESEHGPYFQLFHEEPNHCVACGTELMFRIVHRDGRPNSNEYITVAQHATAQRAVDDKINKE